MSNRKINIERISTTEDDCFIDVWVSYYKGGMSFSTYKQVPRGYSLHVQPVKVKDNWVEFTAFTGVKQHMEEANRFSQKRLKELAQAYKGSDTVQNMIDLVCAKQGIAVKELVK